jgi:Ty3 transposon capsid-like protein
MSLAKQESSSSHTPETQPENAHTISNNQMNQMINVLQQIAQTQQELFQTRFTHPNANNVFSPSTSPPSAPISSSSAASSPSDLLQHGVSVQSSCLPSKVKISPPSNYTGNRTVNVETWLFEMSQYLDTNNVTNSTQRISVASSYFKESALQWWVNQCRSSSPPLNNWSWPQFISAVRERFQPLAASRTARAQLRNLRQSNMSVAEYSNKFYQLVQLITDMSEVDQTELFIYGLRNHLSREVDMKEPRTLQEAMTTAQKVETLLDNRRSHFSANESRGPPHISRRPNYRPLFSTTSNSSSFSNSSNSSSSSPMELGNVQTIPTSQDDSLDSQNDQHEVTDEQEEEYQRYLQEGDNYEPDYEKWQEIENDIQQLQAIQQKYRKPSAISPEEFNRCMELRLCLKCKKPGHISRHCKFQSSTTSSTQRHFQ